MTRRTWTTRALTKAIRDLGYPHIAVHSRAPGTGDVPAGEASTISAARESLAAFTRAAAAIAAAADLLTAELEVADVDASTLEDARMLAATVAELRAAAEGALAGLNVRHQMMEHAVTRTSHPARHGFYRQGGDSRATT